MKQLKHALLKTLQLSFGHWVKLPLNWIGNICLNSICLYCLNFVLLISFTLIIPIISKNGYIFSNIFEFWKFYFIIGFDYHIKYYIFCLIFSLIFTDYSE